MSRDAGELAHRDQYVMAIEQNISESTKARGGGEQK